MMHRQKIPRLVQRLFVVTDRTSKLFVKEGLMEMTINVEQAHVFIMLNNHLDIPNFGIIQGINVGDLVKFEVVPIHNGKISMNIKG